LILRAGADKVAINTALFSTPELITDGASTFGSQSIVVSIHARKIDGTDRYECLTDNGRGKTNQDVFEWVDKIVTLGAGEILLTSVDREGTGNGFDCELVRNGSYSGHCSGWGWSTRACSARVIQDAGKCCSSRVYPALRPFGIYK
jgi:imidazole glycerol phosphate synthase subunit HisF